MPVWNIYYESREFAREMGDPLLGRVEAESFEEAVEKAWKALEIAGKVVFGAGLWAVRKDLIESREARHRAGRQR